MVARRVVTRVGIAALLTAAAIVAPRTAAAKGCSEVSDVVGEEKCSRYGDQWSLEGTFPIWSRFGIRLVTLPVRGLTFTEMIDKGSKRPDGYMRYAYHGEQLGIDSLSATGVDGGFGFFVWGQLYVGFEGAIEIGSATTAPISTTTGVALSDDTGIDVTIYHGVMPIGYRLPLGRAAIRAELAPGFQGALVSQHVVGPGLPSVVSSSATQWLLEPRVAADIWFTQHVSVGAYFGINALGDEHGRAFGLSLAWHHRSFDGDSSF